MDNMAELLEIGQKRPEEQKFSLCSIYIQSVEASPQCKKNCVGVQRCLLRESVQQAGVPLLDKQQGPGPGLQRRDGMLENCAELDLDAGRRVHAEQAHHDGLDYNDVDDLDGDSEVLLHTLHQHGSHHRQHNR